jgi:hypothetical protein
MGSLLAQNAIPNEMTIILYVMLNASEVSLHLSGYRGGRDNKRDLSLRSI